jgi:DNA-binding transcriptional ArsR family regulator
VDQEELAAFLRALGHPMRIAIVCRLGQTGELSPSAFADAHAASLATASHHVRVLAAVGLIQLVRTEPRRRALLRAVGPGTRSVGLAAESTSMRVRQHIGRAM